MNDQPIGAVPLGTLLPAKPAAAARTAAQQQRMYTRFNIHQRLQHFLLVFSFLGLMTTGMPLRFPELAICRMFIGLLGGPEAVGIIHRCLGLIMATSGAYHITYLIVMWFKGHRKHEILFTPLDFNLFLDDMKFFFGLRKEPPRFGRYNWREKFDYFGACFGVALMVATGLVIWFPQIVTWVLPGWTVTAAVLLHEYEALLAGLAIFLSHFYWVHLNPDVYPMSMVWLTGQISEDDLKQQHPLEYEEIKERERLAAEAALQAPAAAAGEEVAQ